MSAGYAQRLSEYKNKGVCGLPEMTESKRTYNMKIDKLAKMVLSSRRVVVLTGAGISTSAGIPDFRGPKGIWTLEEKEKRKRQREEKRRLKCRVPAPLQTEAKEEGPERLNENKQKAPCVPELVRSDSNSSSDIENCLDKKRKLCELTPCTAPPPSFETAKPTLTHRAITKLAELGIVRYCITQNVDGLHRRSGLPRSLQSILHGCVFTEKCELCNREYFRTFDCGGVGFRRTGRKCTDTPGCDGHLRDTVLDWEDELPEHDYMKAMEECEWSDLVICLGTSLRIEPAGGLPTRARKFVVINMQTTPYDNQAALVVRQKVDQVMSDLMRKLDFTDWDKPSNNFLGQS